MLEKKKYFKRSQTCTHARLRKQIHSTACFPLLYSYVLKPCTYASAAKH